MMESVRRAAVLLIGLAAALLPGCAGAQDADGLWKLVSGRCVPDQQAAFDPAPCIHVDLAGGFVVLKDNSTDKPSHYLLIPTARVTGIESPAVLTADAPNYFQDAWAARDLVAARLNRPLARGAIGLAINSLAGRTQGQLHIHIDCIGTDVRAALAASQAGIGTSWSMLPVPLRGHSYRAMRVAGEDLASVRPFVLLADGIPGARAEMGLQTLVAVGAVFADHTPGFYLLEDRTDATHAASGEDLLDYSCAG